MVVPSSVSAGRLSHHAARPVRTDDIAPAMDFFGAIGVAHRHRCAVVVHVHRQGFGTVVQVDRIVVSRHGIQSASEFPLLALQPVGMIGLVLQKPQIERGDLAFLAVAELPCGADQTLFHQCGRYADLLQHVEGRRVERGGPQILRNIVGPFEDGRGDALPRQEGCQYEADRPAANDENSVRGRCHGVTLKKADREVNFKAGGPKAT